METDSLRPIFKQAGNNCNYCYLNFESDEEQERIILQKNAEDSLVQIIKSSNGNFKNKEIAKEAIEKCKKCKEDGYTNPEIFHYLEKQRIKLWY